MKQVPLELMQTFIRVVEHEGNATLAAEVLGISQPTMSRRLSTLRDIIKDSEGQPWLILKGKRWLVTPNGERVLGVVSELVRQYEQVERFISVVNVAQPTISIACGQTAANGFVRLAVQGLLERNPDFRMRVSTPRGKARIEGVAGGQFDIAIVTDNEATIREVAGIDLYIEALQIDRFVVTAKPTVKSSWAKAWNNLPVRRSTTAKDLVGLPMILPEPDAGRRKQFDDWFQRNTGSAPSVVLEVGGWQNLLRFVQSGLGVGFATESAVKNMEASKTKGNGKKSSSSMRFLSEQDFPPDEIRLIARKRQGHATPDLSDSALRLYELLKEEVSRPGGQ